MQKISFKKTEKVFFSLLLIMLFIFPASLVEAQNSVQQNQLKFGRLLRLIDGYYVDTANVDKLTEKAIVNLLSDLDPHSTYISKEEVDKMNEPLVGKELVFRLIFIKTRCLLQQPFRAVHQKKLVSVPVTELLKLTTLRLLEPG